MQRRAEIKDSLYDRRLFARRVVFAAVVAVLVMLTLVFGTIVLRWSIDQDIGRWDDNVRVIAFLSDDLGISDIDAIQAEVQQPSPHPSRPGG